MFGTMKEVLSSPVFDTLKTIFVSLFVFCFLICIHELGHFLMARLFKVTINEFSIGMGPKLMWYDSKKSGTRYSLSMLPIGGYVAMAGEDEESDDPNAFDKKPAWQRFLITLAGALVNLVFGFVAMFIIVAMMQSFTSTTVYKVYSDTEVTELYGETTKIEERNTDEMLLPGDRIIEVEGVKIAIGEELSYLIMRHGNKPVDLVVIREGERVLLDDVVFAISEQDGQVFGVPDFVVYAEEKTFPKFFSVTFRKIGLTMRMCWESVIDLLTGRYTFAAVSGPVGISGAIGDAFSQGFASLLNITVLISINLGFMNLLPIPALDGGRLVTLFVEMVTKKRLPKKVEAIINGVGLALLLLLSVVIMVKDIFLLF